MRRRTRPAFSQRLAISSLMFAGLSAAGAALAQSKGPPPPPLPLRPAPFVNDNNNPPKRPVVLPDPPPPAPVRPALPTIINAPESLPKPVAAPPVPAAPTSTPMAAPSSPNSSQVFPNGEFPSFAPTAPSAVASAQLPGNPVVPQQPPADYGPRGFERRDIQDAPGVAEYSPIPNVVANELYLPVDYFRPVTGPHGYAEYAPPGFEARDYQDAPGVPEFIPITPPAAVTPEERQKFVTRGLFPGSYLVPGTNTSFRFRGFVRLTGIYDFDPIGTPDIFVVNTIPVPQSSGQNFNMTARPSRIATETWTPTNFNNWTIHTFVEADFFNGPGQAAGGGGNPFRLRHAFVDFGYFRVGQQNSVFMDGNTWPSLVDFQGPAGWVNQRRPGARVTLPIADQLFWAGGIEQPFSDITTNGLGTAVQDVPDFATHVRYETDLGHIQVAGLGRAIGYRPTGGEVTRRAGYGFSAGTTFHPWALIMGTNPLRKANPTGLERSRLIGQYTAGWGIGRYILDTVGLGLDGQVDAATGAFDLPYTAAWLMSYEHWFTEKWMVQGTWSETLAGTNTGQPGGTYIGGKYTALSLWYIPVRNLSLGSEMLWGERENVDGDRGRAKRLNALVQYNF